MIRNKRAYRRTVLRNEQARVGLLCTTCNERYTGGLIAGVCRICRAKAAGISTAEQFTLDRQITEPARSDRPTTKRRR